MRRRSTLPRPRAKKDLAALGRLFLGERVSCLEMTPRLVLGLSRHSLAVSTGLWPYVYLTETGRAWAATYAAENLRRELEVGR